MFRWAQRLKNLTQTDDLGAVATADCWEHADQWQYMTACEKNQPPAWWLGVDALLSVCVCVCVVYLRVLATRNSS